MTYDTKGASTVVWSATIDNRSTPKPVPAPHVKKSKASCRGSCMHSAYGLKQSSLRVVSTTLSTCGRPQVLKTQNRDSGSAQIARIFAPFLCKITEPRITQLRARSHCAHRCTDCDRMCCKCKRFSYCFSFSCPFCQSRL